jgi:hypothetical protein
MALWHRPGHGRCQDAEGETAMIHRNNAARQATYLYRIYDRHGALLYVGTAAGPDSGIGAHGNRFRRWWTEAAAARWEEYPDPDEAAYAEKVASILEMPRFGRSSASLPADAYTRSGRPCPDLGLELERYAVAGDDQDRYRRLRLLAARKWCEALNLWRRARREEASRACDWINYFGAELQKISTVTDLEYEQLLANDAGS